MVVPVLEEPAPLRLLPEGPLPPEGPEGPDEPLGGGAPDEPELGPLDPPAGPWPGGTQTDMLPEGTKPLPAIVQFTH